MSKITFKTNEKKLKNIFLKANSPEVREKTLQLSEKLPFFVLTNSFTECYSGEILEIRRKAITQINDLSFLKTLVYDNSDLTIKRLIMNKIDEAEFYKEIAASDSVDTLRADAIKKINDQDFLSKMVMKENKMLAKAALKNINTESVLLKIILSKVSEDIKNRALKKLNDEASFIKIAKAATSNKLKLFAYERIANQNALIELMQYETDSSCLAVLVSKIKKIELIRDLPNIKDSLPMQLLLLEYDSTRMLDDSEICKQIFTKNGLKLFTKLLLTKKENTRLKNEIIKRHQLIKQQCSLIIEKDDDRGKNGKPESLIKLINIFNSYKDLLASLNTADDLVQFLHLYKTYSGIYDLRDFFYSERTKYLDDYDANNNLSDMGRYYDVELRYKKQDLDFKTASNIYDMLKDTLNQKDWWYAALAKTWLNSLSLHFVDKNQIHFPLFIKNITKELLFPCRNDLITNILTDFVNTDFNFLMSEKPDFYFEEELHAYIWEIKWKLGLTESQTNQE